MQNRAAIFLATDFEDIFRDVFNRTPGIKADLLRSLCDGPKNVGGVAEALGLPKNGHLSSSLDQLEEAGFVSEDEGVNPDTGAPVQQKRYRISDNYARFYLKYIEPALPLIRKGRFAFASLDHLAGWESVMGLAFENLVIANFRELLPRFGLERSLLLSAAPFHRKNVQIDLLLQTRRSVCVVEVKRQREIGREIIDEVAAKVEKLPKRKGISVKAALVYEGHLAPIVEADGYFDAIIPFRTLLGL